MQKVTSHSKYLLSALKYIGYFALFYILSKARILGKISPAFFGAYLAIIFMGENIFYTSLSFLSATTLCDASTYSLVFALSCVAIGAVIARIYRKRSFPLWLKGIYTLMTGLVYVYFNIFSLELLYISLIDTLLNSIVAISLSMAIKTTIHRHFSLSLNADEAFCLCLVLAVIFCGVQSVNVFTFDIVRLVGFSIVLLSTLLPSSMLLLPSISMGVGAFLCGGSMEYLAIFCISSSVCMLFKSQSRLFVSLSILVVDVSLGLIGGLHSLYSLISFIPTLICASIFLIIPKSLLARLQSLLYADRHSLSLKNILNHSRAKTSRRLLYTAEVFYEMDKCFRKLVKGSLDPQSAKGMLCGEIIRENCETCHMKNRCMKNFTMEHKKIIQHLVDVGFEKGKITLVDLNSYLTSRCVKLNSLISSINSLLSDYHGYCKMNRELDNSKILVAEQLKGISHVLQSLSQDTREETSMDHKMEKKIMENLTYHDIVPSEVVCFDNNEETMRVAMEMRRVDYDNDKIEKVLSSSMNQKMVLDEILEEGSRLYLQYRTAPTFDIAVGVAMEKKAGSSDSGDTHSMLKLGDDKFMLALCDGMGSGSRAQEKSETSINIIENFYKAGYDDETIISSVNKLLTLTSENVFSAMDISVVDLKNGEVDFIKQGATTGFIKSGEDVHRIESRSLPLGIVSDVKPRLVKTVLSPDDEVIMMTDGVIDAVGEENMLRIIHSISSTNPQEIADELLQKALSSQKAYPQDDMTVIVGRIFYNAS